MKVRMPSPIAYLLPGFFLPIELTPDAMCDSCEQSIPFHNVGSLTICFWFQNLRKRADVVSRDAEGSMMISFASTLVMVSLELSIIFVAAHAISSRAIMYLAYQAYFIEMARAEIKLVEIKLAPAWHLLMLLSVNLPTSKVEYTRSSSTL
jgi:hypothetical protein